MKDIRQTKMVKEFGFVCNCEACLNEWPCFRSLQVGDPKLIKFSKKINDELLQSDLKRCHILKSSRECAQILENNSQKYPSLELCLIQKNYATLLLKLARSKDLF